MSGDPSAREWFGSWQGKRVSRNARRGKKESKKVAAAIRRLDTDLERAQCVVTQTKRRVAEETAIPDRMISLCDVDARPIRRGKIRNPNEFRYKVALGDTPEGFVVAQQVLEGNPVDAETLAPLLQQAKNIGMRVKTVFADRGYGREPTDQVLAEAGIADKVIPRIARADPVESTRNWKRRYRWRSGGEGRISHLKRRFGWNRTRLKDHAGARIWSGFGVLANNLDRIVVMAG